MKHFPPKKNKSFLLIGFLGFSLGLLASFTFAQQRFSNKMISNALAIIGLDFDKKEIDFMREDLEDQVVTYKNIHNSKLPNATSPALIFNPLPRGFELKKEQTKIQYSDYSSTKMPSSLEDLAFYSIGELAHLIKTQQITSVELTKFYLQRLKKHDAHLHCVITFTEELAMRQARRADQEIKAGKYRGLLHGIPYGAKDLFAVKEYKTTWGATPYQNQVIEMDATIIQKLEESGAVLVAKLTMGALAWGDVWFGGRTRNPWNDKMGSSGSSAGSAAAVAAGLLPFAMGTETLGSIISPATVCGVTGLRPTFGRVSRHGAMALSWSMDKVGPLCRTVEDGAIVLDAIRGADGNDLSVIDAPFNYDANFDWKKLRIGFLKNDFTPSYPFQKQDAKTLEVLREMGVTLVPIALPTLPDIGFILEAEAAAAFDELTRSNLDSTLVRQVRNAWPNVFRKARLIPAVEYINANRLRSQLIDSMHQVMQTVDLYVHPSWASNSLTLANLTGHPSVVLPNGFSKNGTPTSISFTGQLFGEAELLRFAKAYQDKTRHHLEHPRLY